MQIGGRLADAIGARKVSLGAMPVIVLAALVFGFAPSFAVAVLGAVLIGLGNGAMDVAMNALGVQVEAARHRPIMSFFHAFWSVGNFIGAGAVLLLATVLGLKGGEIVTPWTAYGLGFPRSPMYWLSWPWPLVSPKAQPSTGHPYMSPTSPASTRPP